MWNNLKSDMYRMIHMRSFYVILAICLIMNSLLLFTTGISLSSPFANFMSDKNTFIDFLYYTIKSPLFLILFFIFLSIFHNDEYAKGFVKNTMPIMHNKMILIIERYFFNMIVCILLWICSIIPAFIREMVMPLTAGGSFQLGDYLLYIFVQILGLCTIASFIMLVNHLTRSKVLLIIYVCFYSMCILYMLEVSLAMVLFNDADIMKYSMYTLSGTLSHNISWNDYSLMIYLIIGYTLLYNGISYLVLKKKDI